MVHIDVTVHICDFEYHTWDLFERLGAIILSEACKRKLDEQVTRLFKNGQQV